MNRAATVRERMERTAGITSVIALLLSGPAGAEESLQLARASLEAAREGQTSILAKLSELTAAGQRAGSQRDLLEQLAAIHRMQSAVVGSTGGLLAATFGREMNELDEGQRQAVGQLAADQRAVRNRWTEWAAAFGRSASGGEVGEAMRVVRGRVEASAAGELMRAAAEQVDENHLSEASATGQKAADELARLLAALDAAVSDPQELRDRQVRELQELIARENRIRQGLDAEPLDRGEWVRLRREQAEVRERTRMLTFEESGLAPNAIGHVRAAHEAMRSAEASMRRQQTEARGQAEIAVRELQAAVEVIASTAGEENGANLPAPPVAKNKPVKAGGMPAMFGEGGAGLDVSPIAQLAADIALVVKLRKSQQELYEETVGDRPAKPVPAGRQLSYAAQVPQLARRVEMYLPAASAALEAARGEMVASHDRLRDDDKPGSAARQKAAIERLAEAEEKMRAFWKELLETLARISSVAGQAPPAGAAGKEEEKAKMEALLSMLKEIVRVGQLIKDQEVLMAKTDGWLAADAKGVDRDAVSEGAAAQRALSTTGLDIVEKLAPLPGDVTGSLTEAVMEAAQFMEGAADSLDALKFKEARERQDAAMEFLENAWVTLARSMASLGESQQRSESNPQIGQGQAEVGEGSVAGGSGEGGEAKPWYWDLPPRARDAVSQSLAEPFPPKYAPSIQRYYERLNRGDRE